MQTRSILDQRIDTHMVVPLMDEVPQPADYDDTYRRHCKSIFGLELINPLSSKAQSWRGLMLLVDVAYILIAQPMFDALRLPLVDFNFLGVCNVFMGLLLLLDPLVKLNTDVVEVVEYERRFLADGRRVAQAYMMTPSFYTDLLAGLPAIPQLITFCLAGVGRPSSSLGVVMWLCRMLRYPRGLLLVCGMFNSGLTMAFGMQVEIGTAYALNAIIITVIIINLMAAMWYAVGICYGASAGWVADQGLTHMPLWVQYEHAVYFSLTTMTTVGYGDAHPTNALETFAAMIVQVAGAFFFSFVVGNVLNLIQSISRQAQVANKFREKMGGVELWMEQGHLPEGLQKGVQAYYRDVWAKQAEITEAEMIAELPLSLRRPIVLHKLTRITQQLPLLSQAPKKARDYILCNGVPMEVTPGHEICREGEAADCMWVLTQGRVRETCLLADREEALEDWIEDSPAILGEAALLGNFFEQCRVRPCTLLAETRCYLFQINLQEIHTVAAVYTHLYMHLVAGMGNDLEVKVLKRRLGHEFMDKAAQAAAKLQKDASVGGLAKEETDQE